MAAVEGRILETAALEFAKTSTDVSHVSQGGSATQTFISVVVSRLCDSVTSAKLVFFVCFQIVFTAVVIVFRDCTSALALTVFQIKMKGKHRCTGESRHFPPDLRNVSMTVYL